MSTRWTPALTALMALLVVFAWLWLVSSRSRTGMLVSTTPVRRGVAADLAAARSREIQSLRYELLFSIPASQSEPVGGHEVIRFALREIPDSLVLDFEPSNATSGEGIRSVNAGGSPTAFTAFNGHILIPSSALQVGNNEIAIEFVAGNDPLNRNPEYLYSLFVPARAHLAFPCFDQPDLKARYTLSLEIPAAWEAIANGAEVDRRTAGTRRMVRFAETQPLPTYLFAFAAGKFQIDAAERNGRQFRMFHREMDAKKLARNRDAIFDLHAAALSWLEEYTAIPYMFGKFDFVLIPSFQFSGMEHAGAILYNASSLLLDETATQDQQLARASTISHETAHMWFGDLVTMRWFDDVWMKEVFANFFAAKIVNPAFPTLNHTLRFLVAHYPASYDIDRTAGANPIRQRLDNLRDAGSLYGNIIYDKAPIVMRQLEALVGAQAFKAGLRDYLKRYSFSNASWPDLIRLLGERTDVDLQAWSHAWVEEPGRPTVRTEIRTNAGRVTELRLTQFDPRNRGLIWNQQLDVVLGYGDDLRTLKVTTSGPVATVPDATGLPSPRYVLPNGGAVGYGFFELDPGSRRALLTGLPDIPDALTRGSGWVTLWDEVLAQHVTPSEFMDLELGALPRESDELNVQQILAYCRSSYWRLLSDTARAHLAPRVEATLREGLTRARATSLKAAYFATLRNVALTADTISFLERVWRRREAIPGLTLSENDESTLALELAVREVPAWNLILQEQLGRIRNADRHDRFAFLMPALAAELQTRDRFFASLQDLANRRHEPWVVDAVAYLNHPLRAKASEHYLGPSLELLEQIQQTGDIFFPKRWLDATFNGHNSPQSAAIVRDFLETHKDYPPRLTQIILQSADMMFRAESILAMSPP